MMRGCAVAVAVALVLAAPVGAASAMECSAGARVSIGGGPLEKIRGLQGQDYNQAYMVAMYRQNQDIARLALVGGDRCADLSARVLSKKIARERVDMNIDLRDWDHIFANAIMPPAPRARFEGLRDLSGSDFDCRYRAAMIGLMSQSVEAADWIVENYDIVSFTVTRRSPLIPQLVRQARTISRVNRNEIRAIGGTIEN